MMRARLVPTRIASATELAAALRELGLRDVEIHPEPVPLVSWQGKPTGREAHVVVRRSSIGVTADDVGFARNARGGFDAVLTEIHLHLFTPSFFAKLEKRCTTLIDGPADAFSALAPIVAPRTTTTESKPLLAPRPAHSPHSPTRPKATPVAHPAAMVAATPVAPARPAEPAAPPSEPAGNAFLDPSVHRGVDAAVEAATARAKAPGLGCIVVLVVPVLIAMPAFASGKPAAFVGGLIFAIFGWAIGGVAWLAVRARASARAGAAAFEARFRAGSPERAAALKMLRQSAESMVDAQSKKLVQAIARRLDPRLRSIEKRAKRYIGHDR